MRTYTGLFYICYVILFSLLACTEKEVAQKTLEPNEFEQNLITQRGILLDVRTPTEYKEGHLAHSINIDYKADDFKKVIAQLDRNKPYFVYCKAGVRSQKATEIMRNLGFTQLYNLNGGIDAWRAEGLPLQK